MYGAPLSTERLKYYRDGYGPLPWQQFCRCLVLVLHQIQIPCYKLPIRVAIFVVNHKHEKAIICIHVLTILLRVGCRKQM